jgi:single-stranded-DNA-specific exonuclease
MEGKRAPILIQLGEWPAGISGLLASKLVDTYGLPAFVGGVTEDGAVAVSARGTAGTHIDEILEACEASVPGGLFVGFGGHSRAGGFRVTPEQAKLALRILEEQAQGQVPIDGLGAVITVDAEVPLQKLTTEAASLVRSLAPFGTGFSEPLFLCRRVTLRRLRPLSDGRHVRLKLQEGHAWRDGIYFNADPEFLRLPLGVSLDLVFHLQLDEWQGLPRPEIKVRDWRLSG